VYYRRYVSLASFVLSCLNRYNAAADCSNSLKFVTEFDHMTADAQDQRV